MPDNFTIKHGIKLGIGFYIGTAIIKGIDTGLAQVFSHHTEAITNKIIKSIDKMIYGDEPKPVKKYGPRNVVDYLSQETPTGN